MIRTLTAPLAKQLNSWNFQRFTHTGVAMLRGQRSQVSTNRCSHVTPDLLLEVLEDPLERK
jgi:hypothetical protein